MISLILGCLSIHVCAHVGLISLTGSDGDDSKALWGWKSNDIYGGARRGWYSSGGAQHYKYNADLTLTEMAIERQLLGLGKNPELPQDACTGGTQVSTPAEAISNAYILREDWRKKLWNWNGKTWTATEAASFCPGEDLLYRFWVAADHNGFQRIEVLLEDHQLSSEAKPNGDGVSHEFTPAFYLTQDPKTTYSLKDGTNNVDTHICQEGVAEGEAWTPYSPHCYDQVFGERIVTVPTWFNFDDVYILRWTYYGGMQIMPNGEVAHAQGGEIDGLPDAMKAEKAFFARCITMKIKSASECGGGAVTDAPVTSSASTTTKATTSESTTASTTATTTKATTTKATTTKATTTKATTTKATTTVAATSSGSTSAVPTIEAPISSAPAEACSGLYKQCGGMKWTGPTCCSTGYICQRKNKYYSKCIEDPNAEPMEGVADYDKCGGKNYTGTTICANPDSVCTFKNEYYSQCRPSRILEDIIA